MKVGSMMPTILILIGMEYTKPSFHSVFTNIYFIVTENVAVLKLAMGSV
jgi:hypothetical protein